MIAPHLICNVCYRVDYRLARRKLKCDAYRPELHDLCHGILVDPQLIDANPLPAEKQDRNDQFKD